MVEGSTAGRAGQRGGGDEGRAGSKEVEGWMWRTRRRSTFLTVLTAPSGVTPTTTLAELHVSSSGVLER